MFKAAQYGALISHLLDWMIEHFAPLDASYPFLPTSPSLSTHPINKALSLQSADAFILNNSAWKVVRPVDHCSCHSL